METLTRDQLLEIIIALDNEIGRAQSDKVKGLQELKWKVFAFMVKAEAAT